MDDLVRLLEETRQRLDLSIAELWWRLFAIGGTSTELELEAILYHSLIPTVEEWDLMATALNERSCELGMDHPIPYSTDTPDAWGTTEVV